MNKGELEQEFDRLNDAQRRDRTFSAFSWWKAQIRLLAGEEYAKPGVDRRGQASVVTSRQKPFVGGMFQYAYDAKTKDSLPYWDAFPLVIPIEFYDDGMLGLNLHYLPVKARIKMLDKLMSFMKHEKTGGHGQRTYMRLSYSMLKGLHHMAGFEFMIKRYLWNHVQSRIMRIHHTAWKNVAYLPTQHFQKASAATVWADASAHIHRAKKAQKRSKK